MKKAHVFGLTGNFSPKKRLKKENRQARKCLPISGGEGGIRTLEPLLTITRFPIVRARPATRLLRTKQYAIILSREQTTATAISYHKRAVLSRDFCIFLPENLFLFRLPKANSAKKENCVPETVFCVIKKSAPLRFLLFFAVYGILFRGGDVHANAV